MEQYAVEVKELRKYFPIHAGLLHRTVGHVKAVDGVSFGVKKGETLGIVGESGCGKSTTGRMIMRFLQPTSGDILIDGKHVDEVTRSEAGEFRKKIQMVFQDPYASLNPKRSVGQTVAEPLIVNRIMPRADAMERAAKLLETVGLKSQDMHKYPHEFSGGQRQRIGIARALALNPRLIVADEAVSALDVSIQSQILNLLMELKNQYHLSYLFISHNLAVVRHISDRVGVMYLGHLVEIGPKHSVYSNPLHPYTEALLSAALEPRRQSRRQRIVLQGDVPNPANPPSGCPFHTRCPKAMKVCRMDSPEIQEVSAEHLVACHLYA
ncbi:ABC transporter ATP-binding protein [Alicyclobacillus acidiphilus]|uniref:ABC transporter ATP-binding protein n=1 Tax=Alicyclobacillus acidiphilus TaxID=182455 RepID=UPI00082A1CE0|nr:dipeptide ABC transporter ATP-binding protein [Alicyclobacillus acidiphilus]